MRLRKVDNSRALDRRARSTSAPLRLDILKGDEKSQFLRFSKKFKGDRHPGSLEARNWWNLAAFVSMRTAVSFSRTG
jgi:hypothetical protein